MTSINQLKQRSADNLRNRNYWPGFVSGLIREQLNSSAATLVAEIVTVLFYPAIYICAFLLGMVLTGYKDAVQANDRETVALFIFFVILLYCLVIVFAAVIAIIASGIANTVVGIHINVGYWAFHKNRKYKTGRFTDIFKGFHRYKHLIRLGWKHYGSIMLRSLLFVVPGIIQYFRNIFVPMIASEHPEMSAEEILEMSQQMTEGKKGFLFKLALSFAGWYLLGILSWGVGLFFLIPYMRGTFWEAYEDAKAEYTGSAR